MPLRVPKEEEFQESRFSSLETASYSKDILKALKCIAERQQHHRLAELLEVAAAEADRLTRVAGDCPRSGK